MGNKYRGNQPEEEEEEEKEKKDKTQNTDKHKRVGNSQKKRPRNTFPFFFQFDLFNLTSFFQILKKIFIIYLFGIWNLELLIFIIFTEIVIKHFGYV